MQGTPPVTIKLSTDKEADEPWRIRGSPAKRLIKSCPDTGVLNEKEAKRMGLSLKKTEVKLDNASGNSMRVVGECVLFAQVEGGRAQRIRIIVSPDLKDTTLLGWKSQKQLRILHKNWPGVIQEEASAEMANQVKQDENVSRNTQGDVGKKGKVRKEEEKPFFPGS